MKKLTLTLALLLPLSMLASPLHVGHARVYIKYCITHDRHDTYDEDSSYVKEYCSDGVRVFYYFDKNNNCIEQHTFYPKSLFDKLLAQLNNLTPISNSVWINNDDKVYYELLVKDGDPSFCIRNWKKIITQEKAAP